MLGKVINFTNNNSQSYSLGEQNIKKIVEENFDSNKDGILTNDEMQISSMMKQKIDSNKDGIGTTVEFVDALKNNKIAVGNLSDGAPGKIAALLIPGEKLHYSALGSIGKIIDKNKDKFITKDEMTEALTSNKVILNGNYLTKNNTLANVPDIKSASEFLKQVKSEIMSKSYGQYVESSGTLTHADAKEIIKGFISNSLIPTEGITSKDKIKLIKSEIMNKSYGQYVENSGTFTHQDANKLIKETLTATTVDEQTVTAENVKNHVKLIKSEIMNKSYGQYVENSGTLTHKDAGEMVKTYLSNSLPNTENITYADKLKLVKSEIMNKSYGQYVESSGTLTHEDATSVVKSILVGTNSYQPDLSNEKAQERIKLIKSEIMNKSYGQYIESSGTLTHKEAGELVKSFISGSVASSEVMSNSDKIKLIKSEIMNKSYGEYVPASGTLTHSDATSLVKSVFLNSNNYQNDMNADQVKEQIKLIRSQIMNKSYGQYVPSSGTLTHEDANDLMKNFLLDSVVNSENISYADKVKIIKSQIMNKSYGEYVQSSGTLTQDDAKDLIKQIQNISVKAA